MFLIRPYRKCLNNIKILHRNLSSDPTQTKSESFETVFSFPTIKYISLINRLKVYHLSGTAIAVPSCGVLEMANIFPDHTCLSASYIGLTAAAVLCLATWPFRNIIGFIYISEDNKNIKISSVNYWGKRVDKIIPTEDWIPLMDMSPKPMDAVFLSPQLADGTQYKLLLRFGKILNAKKMGEVLE